MDVQFFVHENSPTLVHSVDRFGTNITTQWYAWTYKSLGRLGRRSPARRPKEGAHG
jgi:hypothetical protein